MDVSLPKISIIVPVYNVEKYLNKCLDSILAQTFEDYELLLIDDGSSDKSGNICDEYEKKDKRVKVFHKENGGQSSARNAGIDAACGEYIGFIDSDDYIDNDMFEQLYNDVTKNDADVAVCGIYNCYSNVVRLECSKNIYRIVDNEEALRLVLESKIVSVHACNKLFKKECFAEDRFPVGMTSEDAYIIPEILSKCKKIVINTTAKYYYVHRSNSTTSSCFNESDYGVVKAYTKNLKLVKEKFPRCVKEAEFRYFWAHAYVLDKMLLTENFKDYDKLNEIVSFLRKNTFKILCNPCFLRSRKLASVVLLFSKTVYKKMLVYNRTKLLNLYS